MTDGQSWAASEIEVESLRAVERQRDEARRQTDTKIREAAEPLRRASSVIPIRQCLVAKAAQGDENAYQRLLSALLVNAKHGAFLTLPCEHGDQCGWTEEQGAALEDRLKREVDGEVVQ